jgi:hypothetical protein
VVAVATDFVFARDAVLPRGLFPRRYRADSNDALEYYPYTAVA